jgi:hypothetical protein
MNALKKQTPPGNGGAAVATFNEKPFDRLKRIKIKTADAFARRHKGAAWWMLSWSDVRNVTSRYPKQRAVARKNTARIDAAKRTGKSALGLEMAWDTGSTEWSRKRLRKSLIF